MKQSLFLFFIMISTGQVCAQSTNPEVLSTAGKTFQGNAIQLDWTIGDLAISSIQNSNYQITQGFHQPYYIVSKIHEFPLAIGQIKLFPNPTTDYLSLEFSFEEQSTFIIQLFDTSGKMIWVKTKKGKEIEDNISLRDLPNGSYFLSFIVDETLYSKTFKIQKIN